jgi:hypothetical protein
MKSSLRLFVNKTLVVMFIVTYFVLLAISILTIHMFLFSLIDISFDADVLLDAFCFNFILMLYLFLETIDHAYKKL